MAWDKSISLSEPGCFSDRTGGPGLGPSPFLLGDPVLRLTLASSGGTDGMLEARPSPCAEAGDPAGPSGSQAAVHLVGKRVCGGH